MVRHHDSPAHFGACIKCPKRTTAIRHDFERDAIGRLVSKRTEDGTTDYRYDAADNLLSITFTDNQSKKQQLD
ncbi:RHS repeat domain-containing protein [Pseudomonas sp.]|uniref:RHS repeat domain-containing protein n=1 Tax=Pseudomonas sp. TaxID=306 RepID=UPI00338D46DD